MNAVENGIINFTREQDLDEKVILSRPWALELMKKIKTIAKKSVLLWCNKVIVIGENQVSIDDWLDIFAEQVERSFTELVSDVENLQAKVMDEIECLLGQMEQLCKDLHMPLPVVSYKKLSFYEARRELEKLVQEYDAKASVKRKELQELRDKQMELCRALDAEPFLVTESPLPSPSELEKLQNHIEKLEAEKFNREEKYCQLRGDIVELVNELNLPPTLEFEKEILSTSNMEHLITTSIIKQIENYHDTLQKRAKSVREDVSRLRLKVDSLWEILDVDLVERDAFRQKYTGNSLDTLEALKTEIIRLENLKKINIKIFIEKKREELKGMWDMCHCDGAQKNDFQYLYSDIYSEDLLEIHEREIEKWTNYYEANRELLELVEKHQSLWDQLLELERSCEGPNRFKNRGGKLLKEEKERNKLSKKIPEYEQRLLELAEIFEVKRGYPFRTFGKTVTEHIERLHEAREEERKIRLSSRKLTRENTLTPAKSYTNLGPSTSGAYLRTTPLSVAKKRSPLSEKKSRGLRDGNANKTKAAMPALKVTAVSQSRRLSVERRKRLQKCRRISRMMALKRGNLENEKEEKENQNDTNTTEYASFERDLSNKDGCRSTIFQQCNIVTGDNGLPKSNDKSSKKDTKTPSIPRTPRPLKAPGTPKTPKTPGMSLRTPNKENTGLRNGNSPYRTSPGPTGSKLKAAPSSLKLIF